jgi:hypothetical protein
MLTAREILWLRSCIIRMRTLLRYGKDSRVEAGLQELISEGETRLEWLRVSAGLPKRFSSNQQADGSAKQRGPMNKRSTEVVFAHQPPQEVAKLISKLRWIGMDDEARQLQTAVATLPPDARGTTSAEPLSTD